MPEPLNGDEVLELEGWVPLATAATRMGLSTNGLRKRVFEYNEFGGNNVRKLSVGTNVIFVLRESQVDKAVAAEEQERKQYEEVHLPAIERRKAKQDQRKDILAWAHRTQFGGPAFPVPTLGRLSHALIEAYLKDTGKKLIE